MAFLSSLDTLDNRQESGGFSLTPATIGAIFRHARPLGHAEQRDQLNLGFGFLYYGLARSLRPKHVVVIGSGFGFSVVCLALALKDNGRGRLSFVDPSYSVITDGPFKTVGGMSQWSDPDKVRRHFSSFGVEDVVTHYRMRSEDFFMQYPASGRPPIDLAFIDGSHSFDDVKHDFIECARHGGRNSYLLLHDTNIYLREMVRHAGVKRWLKSVKSAREAFELVDFPLSSGLAVVRVLTDESWKALSSRPQPWR
jgi:predicted O-methyltransferase YrrM